MTLVIDYDGFADALERFGEGGKDCVFLKKVGDSIHITYVNPKTGIQIVSFTGGPEDKIKKELESQGVCSMRGTWVTEASLEHLAQLTTETYVAAVAYDTRKGPGLWVDAFQTPPTEGIVLRAVFDEFVSEGLMDERAFEQFIHDAKPIVRILDPSDFERFVKQKAQV